MLVIREKFLQSVLNKNCRFRQTLFQGLPILKPFEALLFVHAPSVVSSPTEHKVMSVEMSNTMGNPVGVADGSRRVAWCNVF